MNHSVHFKSIIAQQVTDNYTVLASGEKIMAGEYILTVSEIAHLSTSCHCNITY